MLISLVAIVVCLGLALLHPPGIIVVALIIIAGGAFGLVFDSQIPLVLGMLPGDRTGLATGLYFGGMGAATAILSISLQQSGKISPTSEFLWSAIAFFLVLFSLNKTPALRD
jgi:hypothetical protein